jgi:hypothetical protein
MRTILFYLVCVSVAGCKKTYDVPPLSPADENARLGITQLKSRISSVSPYYRFAGGDTNIYCTVTADETSGNLYGQVYVRDDEGSAMEVRINGDGGLFVGDRIRINLNHSYVIFANNLFYLDSVNTEKAIVKLSSGNEVVPKVTTLAAVLQGAFNPLSSTSFQSQLVELNGVEFDALHRSKPFADAIGKLPAEHIIRDCFGKSVALRTSGRSNFASKLTPAGNGKLVAMVSQYNDEMQLIMRDHNDLKMSAPPCTGILTGTAANTATFVLAAPVTSISESFNEVTLNLNFEQAGWINFNETGSAKWKGSVKSGSYKAVRASAFATGETNSMWLISPPVIFSPGMKLSFKTGVEYYTPGHVQPIMAYVCTDFNGKNLLTANWTKIETAAYANGGDVNYTGPLGIKSSGEIVLKDVEILKNYTGNLFIAFRYSGSPAFTSNIYLDDIYVK